MLIDLPRAMLSSIADSPSCVAGILTIRFGRSTSLWIHIACSNVPTVS